MADKSDRDVSHAMLGLNVSERRQATPPEGTPTYPGGGPQPVYVQAPPPSPMSFSGGQIMFLLVLVLLVVSGVNLYLVLSARADWRDTLSKHSDELDLLSRRLDSSDERYAQLSAKFQVSTEKLGFTQQELARARSLAADIQKGQQQAVQQLNEAIAKKAGAEEVNKLQADANSKFGNLSGDIAGTRKDLEATKQALMGAKGELTGAIARTHDELVALAHKTDRDYFEFTINGKRARQKVGGVTIELGKTDLKRNTFAVNLIFDDKAHPKKDWTTNEPLFFYVSGAHSAFEFVVNKMGKDSIAGYLSTPKAFFPNTPNVLGSRPGA